MADQPRFNWRSHLRVNTRGYRLLHGIAFVSKIEDSYRPYTDALERDRTLDSIVFILYWDSNPMSNALPLMHGYNLLYQK